MNKREIMEQEFIKRAGYKPTNEELDKFINNNRDLFLLKNKNNTTKEGFHWNSILLIVWFFSSIAAIIYFGIIEEAKPLLLIFGHYFLIFGIMVVFSIIKYSKDSTFIFIIGLAFITYLVFFPDGIKIGISDEQLMMIIIGALFAGGGILMKVLTNQEVNEVKKYIPIQAAVCGYVNGKNRTKACVFEYEYEGKKYSAMESFYTNVRVLPIGSIKEIKINPDNPDEIDENNPLMKVFMNIFLWFFIIIGLALAISSFFIF